MTIGLQLALQRPGFALDTAFDLPARGVTALYGPSGSGKTTLLRCIAGLEPAAVGRLTLGARILQDSRQGIFVPVHERGFGLVFQEGGLFPHLDVRRNLEFGWRRTLQAQRRIGLDDVTALMALEPLLQRSVAGLSGGERQRVAIGRALLMSPELLLMDEPLSGLDAGRKEEVLPYLARLQRELDIPIIYVTHAIDELLRLADHVVLLDGGRCVANAPLAQALSDPRLPAAFLDEVGTVLEARLIETDTAHALMRFDTACGAIWASPGRVPNSEQRRLRILARDVSIALQAPAATSVLNVLPATVATITPTPHAGHVLVGCHAGQGMLLARITARSCDHLQLQAGMPVWLQVKSVSLS